MQRYPSIPTFKEAGMPKIASCIAFEKLDGSNLRTEYRKGQWDKFGTRTKLFDQSHEVFGPAIALFRNEWQEEITRILKHNKAQEATAFFEYYGPNSFAGVHDLNDEMTLTLIDIHVFKQGLMPAREFVKTFGHLAIPKIVYEGNFNQQFVLDIEDGKYDVVEGVVAKGGNKHSNLWIRKIKTKSYLDKLSKFGYEDT